MSHAILAQAASGLIGGVIGMIAGGFIGGARHAALRGTIALRDATIESYEARCREMLHKAGRDAAMVKALVSEASVGRKVLAQRSAALVKANAANAARAKAKAA